MRIHMTPYPTELANSQESIRHHRRIQPGSNMTRRRPSCSLANMAYVGDIRLRLSCLSSESRTTKSKVQYCPGGGSAISRTRLGDSRPYKSNDQIQSAMSPKASVQYPQCGGCGRYVWRYVVSIVAKTYDQIHSAKSPMWLIIRITLS